MSDIQIYLLLLTQALGLVLSVQLPPNPCPSVFSYVFEGGQWIGKVTLPTPKSQTVLLNVTFTIQDTRLRDYGKVELSDKDRVLYDIQNGRPIIYKIRFPASYLLPQVRSIEFNNVNFCSGPAVNSPSTIFWLQHTFNWKLTYTPHTTNPVTEYTPRQRLVSKAPVFTPKITTFPNWNGCGTVRNTREIADDNSTSSEFVPYIYYGVPVGKNSHPWLAALFDIENGALKFFCGANLISNQHVLTAAHCTASKTEIRIKVGAHNTKEAFDIGAILTTSKTITRHPEYITNNAHADIAIILLSTPVDFTTRIKPICIWHNDFAQTSIVGQTGTIMGWGLNEKGEAAATPVQTDVDVVSQQECGRVNLLRDVVSDKTFCAGKKGTGPCLGDSGGGFFLIKDGQWYLRGIISTSIADRFTQECDVDTFSVYVDTARYINWIISNMQA